MRAVRRLMPSVHKLHEKLHIGMHELHRVHVQLYVRMHLKLHELYRLYIQLYFRLHVRMYKKLYQRNK